MRCRIDGRFISLKEALAQKRHGQVRGRLLKTRPVNPGYKWPPGGLRWITRNGYQHQLHHAAMIALSKQIQLRRTRFPPPNNRWKRRRQYRLKRTN